MDSQRRGRTAVIVALIAALGGLATAVVNRIYPNEPTATVTYEETRRAVNEMQRDLIRLDVRLEAVESKRGKKRNRRKPRRELPEITVLQSR